MKNKKYINLRFIALLSIAVVIFSACERGFSDDVDFAEFPPNGDVFLDAFSAGLDYFPFVDAGADPEAFSVETDEVFQGEAAMRFDVPAFGNGFVGATFNTTAKRNLSGFDALTFYAKASQAATLDAIGFGISGETGNKYQVTLNGLGISTRWEKYVIPIPDATNLTNETGLFWLAEGASFEGDEGGYVLFFDEIKFEKLGTVAQPQPSILGGNEGRFPTIVGESLTIGQLQQTFNLESGINQTVIPAPSYFNFTSSDPNVAFVNELGEVTVLNTGTAEISASIAGVRAKGGILVESSETAQIISIFSDLFADVPVDNFNGFFIGQGTLGGVVDENENDIIQYTNLDFVSINFFSEENRIDASEMTTLNLQIRVDEAIDPNDFIRLELNNFLNNVESGSSFTIESSELIANEFVDFSIPLSNFQGLTDRSGLGLLFFVTDGTISNISIDNIFFSAE